MVRPSVTFAVPEDDETAPKAIYGGATQAEIDTAQHEESEALMGAIVLVAELLKHKEITHDEAKEMGKSLLDVCSKIRCYCAQHSTSAWNEDRLKCLAAPSCAFESTRARGGVWFICLFFVAAGAKSHCE